MNELQWLEMQNQIKQFENKLIKVIEGVIFDVIKKSNPSIVEIADITILYHFDDLIFRITFFVTEYMSFKEQEKVRKDIQNMLNLMQIDSLELEDKEEINAIIEVRLVENS